MIIPSGMFGACSITVPTPNVCRSCIGDDARRVVRYASEPVIDSKSLVMNALRNPPLATSFTTSTFLARLEFVSFCVASSEGTSRVASDTGLRKAFSHAACRPKRLRRLRFSPHAVQWCGHRLLHGLKGLVEQRCRQSQLELRCFEGLVQWVPHSIYSYVLHLDARPLGD